MRLRRIFARLSRSLSHLIPTILNLRYRKAYVHKVNRYLYGSLYIIPLIKRKDRKCVYSCEIFPSPLKKSCHKFQHIYILLENKGNCIWRECNEINSWTHKMHLFRINFYKRGLSYHRIKHIFKSLLINKERNYVTCSRDGHFVLWMNM